MERMLEPLLFSGFSDINDAAKLKGMISHILNN